jgi:hypothetical protein
MWSQLLYNNEGITEDGSQKGNLEKKIKLVFISENMHGSRWRLDI